MLRDGENPHGGEKRGHNKLEKGQNQERSESNIPKAPSTDHFHNMLRTKKREFSHDQVRELLG